MFESHSHLLWVHKKFSGNTVILGQMKETKITSICYFATLICFVSSFFHHGNTSAHCQFLGIQTNTSDNSCRGISLVYWF